MDRHLDKYTEKMNLEKFYICEEQKNSIIGKTKRKLGRHKGYKAAKGIAAVFAVILFLSAFIPGTPVNALYKKVFSFIPGVGVVETEENGYLVKVLKDPVTVESGKEYVTVETAYVQNNRMAVYIRTNVGLAGAADFADKDLLKFYAGEINPKLYLVFEDKRIESISSILTGAAQDGTYRLRANYELSQEMIEREQHLLVLEGFEPGISISLSEAMSGSELKQMGSLAVTGELYVFADMRREADTVRIQLSTVAPKDLKGIYFEPFDHEKKYFLESIYLTDSKGNVYRSDQELNKNNHVQRNTFYFRVPEERKGLTLIIPQVMYNRSPIEEVQFKIPQINQPVDLNETIWAGEHVIHIRSIELLSKESDLIPKDIKGHEAIKINFAEEKPMGAQETIMRVMPTLKVKKGLFGQYQMVSQAVYSEVWNPEKQFGYAICTLDDLEEYKYGSISIDIECMIISEVELKLE